MTFLSNTKNIDQVGIPILSKVVSAQIDIGTQVMTRNVLKQQAMHTAEQCVFGDFIDVEVFNP
jgi:hypothetical protein